MSNARARKAVRPNLAVTVRRCREVHYLRVGMALLACTTLLAASYSRPAVLPRHSPIAASATAENAFSLLDGVKVLHVSDGAEVALNQQWKDDERCALFFFRSFG